MSGKDEDGNTPLHNLCRDYNKVNLIDIVQFLIKKDASANAKNKKGEAPLHLLCRCYKIDNSIKEDDNLRSLVLLFSENGASMNEKDNWGTSPNDYLIRRNKTTLAMEFANRKETINKDEENQYLILLYNNNHFLLFSTF